MRIDLSRETEEIVLQHIRSGHFRTPSEVVDAAVRLLSAEASTYAGSPTPITGTLSEFFRSSPLFGLDLDFERIRGLDRPHAHLDADRGNSPAAAQANESRTEAAEEKSHVD